MQKPFLADRALFIDQDTVHHRNLAGRSAEAQRCDPRPHLYGFAERVAMALSAVSVAAMVIARSFLVLK